MNLPNKITVLRILMVPVFIALLLYSRQDQPLWYISAVSIFTLVCLTDALDGYLARRFDLQTDLGRYIDPIADKLLLLSGFLCLSLMPHLPEAAHIPGWVTIAVIARDIIILIGSIVIYLIRGKLTPQPLFIGKMTTVLQMGTLLVSLLLLPQEIRAPFFIVTTGLTLVSGLIYIRLGSRLLATS